MAEINCQCGSPVPSNRKDCPACGRDCGFPNVRLASAPNEVAALDRRVNDAEISAKARGCSAQLSDFAAKVEDAKAVIARALSVVDDLVKSDLNHYTSFQSQVQAGVRSPEDNQWDAVRTQYESALYPNFYNQIVFGCLTLSDEGLTGYGGFSMILRNDMVSHRISLFEENPHNFVDRHGILMNKPFPSGYRATWDTKSKLAVAKLYSRITVNTEVSDYPGILQTDNGGTGDSDFIEVHVYGSVNRRAIEKVVGRKPKTGEDRLIWRRVQRHLKSIGAEAVEL